MASLPTLHNIRIEVIGAKKIANRIKKIPQNLKALEKSFWARKSNSYKIFAKWLVLNVVYGAYAPKVYQRTYKLRNSIKSQRFMNGLMIYQDSSMTPEAVTSHVHRWPSYAFYFLYGGGFLAMKNAKPQRDFLSAWHKYFLRKFPLDYRNEVVRPALSGK